MQEQKLELIDIYDITYNPWWLSGWFKIALITVAALVCLVVAVVLYRKYRKKQTVAYWQKSINDIQKLGSKGFDDGQIFYVQLTEIMKKYLQKRYAIHLVDKTDSELLELLKDSSVFPQKVYDDLKDIFEGATFIKFAHQEAAKERMQEAAHKGIFLIQKTHTVAAQTESKKRK